MNNVTENIYLLEEVKTIYKKRNRSNTKIKSYIDAIDYLKKFINFEELTEEHFYTIYLNKANNVVGWHHISMGSIAGTVVSITKILKSALDCYACGLVIIHNHPSGNHRPSEADKVMTDRIKQSAKIMDIELIDSIIVTHEESFSFANEGLI
ncbi:DNA repair protein RadC [Gammaproteobacteria bacterium]